MSLPPGTRLGPYEISSLLGVGGMGEVYRGRDTRLNRDVAIKILPETFSRDADRLRRFEREAQTLAALNHPRIAQIYGLEGGTSVPPAGAAKATPSELATITPSALVMELVEGPTLAERLERGPLPLDDAVDIAVQIAEALEAAHDRGIVHRDLKPANIKLTTDGQVKVLDFGLAYQAPGARLQASGAMAAADVADSPTFASPAMTQAGIILGTAAYMSPEQARGKVVDRRADLWALGCVLFEMVTGTRPFDGETVTDILGAVVRAEPDWSRLPHDTPPPVERVLRRCLRKDVKQRIGHASAILIDLQDTSEPPRARVVVPSRRQSAKWIAAMAIAVAATALSMYGIFGARAPAGATPTPMLRADVLLPDIQFADQFALSPDGRSVAFLARSGSGFRVVAVQNLETNEARQFEKTGGANGPFWSPDGTRVGFLTGGRVQFVNASSGELSPVSIAAPAVPERGARIAWGANDTLLMGGVEGIVAVAADGSQSRPVTRRGTDEVFHRDPQFLPDGRRFVYTAASADRRIAKVYLASLDNDSRELIPGANGTAGLALGRLFYEREGRLYGQSIDPDRPTVAAPPTLVADAVLTDVRTLRVALSVSPNGVLLYRDRDSGSATRLVAFDREGKSLREVAMAAMISNVAMAPDSQRVAYNTIDVAGGTVWTHHLERGSRTQLSDGTSRDADPIWSPDGSAIVYGSTRASDFAIHSQSSGGGGRPETLVTSDVTVYPSTWSRDGRFLIYTRIDPQTNRDLWLYTFADGSIRILVQKPGADDQADFAPDGRWIVYASGPSRREVYVRAFDGTDREWQVTTAGALEPHWREDGKELFYIDATTNRLMSVDVMATALGPEFGPPRQLFEMPLGAMSRARYAVYDQGRRFLVASIDPNAANRPAHLIVNWPQLFRSPAASSKP